MGKRRKRKIPEEKVQDRLRIEQFSKCCVICLGNLETSRDMEGQTHS